MSDAAKAIEADADDESADLIGRFRAGWFGLRESSGYHLTRFAVLRWLGAMYLVAFLVSFFQLRGLIGQNGILPAAWFLSDVREQLGAGASWTLPTLFWLDHSDGFMVGAAGLGALLGALAMFGLSNAAVFAVLWLLYLSLIHVGQTFYSFGWEILLLEVGFLAIFLAPVRKLGPLAPARVPVPVIWLLRWLAFRLMFGAGLIKVRGDDCWTDLTCLQFHYETQPNPSPLSWYFHHLPPAVHIAGVLFNHFVELIVPWGMLGPRRVRNVAGILLVVFQVTLILSGNLSFLNWLTIGVCLSCFDDAALLRIIPRLYRSAIERRLASVQAAPAESKLRRGVI